MSDNDDRIILCRADDRTAALLLRAADGAVCRLCQEIENFEEKLAVAWWKLNAYWEELES